VAEGDATALAELYDRYANAIFRAAFLRLGDRQMAEEVLQDTYLALWQHALVFDPRQGSLLAWLSTIARNRAVDRLRQLSRRLRAIPLASVLADDEHDERGIDRLLAKGSLLGSGARSVDPQRLLDEAALRDHLRGMLASIPLVERQVLELAYYQELTQAEIAARLGWPLGTVKTRTRRALHRLRQTLTDAYGPEVAPPMPDWRLDPAEPVQPAAKETQPAASREDQVGAPGIPGLADGLR